MQESMSKGHVNGKNGIRKAHVYERWIDLIKRGNCSPHVETIRLLSNFFFFFFGSRRGYGEQVRKRLVLCYLGFENILPNSEALTNYK